jgi:hypothetical protein
MHDEQNSAVGGISNADIPFFKIGVLFVGKSDKKRIKEKALGLFEANSVLVFIASGFPGIPLKYDFHSISPQNLGYHIVGLVTNEYHVDVMR